MKIKNAIKTGSFALAGGLAISLTSFVPAQADDVVSSVLSTTNTTMVLTTDHTGSSNVRISVLSNCTVAVSGITGTVTITVTSGSDCDISVTWYKVNAKGEVTDPNYGSLSGSLDGIPGDPPMPGTPTPPPVIVVPEPELQQGEAETRVYFTPDSPKLGKAAIKRIKKLVKELPEGATNIVVTITGYIHPTTETDPELKAFRQSLPELRAKRVKRQLAKLGIEAEFEIVGVKTPLSADPKSRRAVITLSYTY
jgi:outer membrane protein OmpA-like peptidoglycan-associated protein